MLHVQEQIDAKTSMQKQVCEVWYRLAKVLDLEHKSYLNFSCCALECEGGVYYVMDHPLLSAAPRKLLDLAPPYTISVRGLSFVHSHILL